MGYLSRNDVLQSEDFETTEVEVPEWGGTLLVRELSAAEIERIGFGGMDSKGNRDVRAAEGLRMRIITWAAIAEDGSQLFNKGDVEKLATKSGKVVARVFNAIQALSGIAPAEEERPLAIECPHCGAVFQVDLVQLDEQYEAEAEAAGEEEEEAPSPNP
jgi:hypothetical protein